MAGATTGEPGTGGGPRRSFAMRAEVAGPAVRLLATRSAITPGSPTAVSSRDARDSSEGAGGGTGRTTGWPAVNDLASPLVRWCSDSSNPKSSSCSTSEGGGGASSAASGASAKDTTASDGCSGAVLSAEGRWTSEESSAASTASGVPA